MLVAGRRVRSSAEVDHTRSPPTRPLPPAALTVVATLAGGAALQGGFHPPGLLLLTVGAGAAVVVACATGSPVALRHPVVGSAAALALWAVARAGATGDVAAALPVVALTAALVAIDATLSPLPVPVRERVLVGLTAVAGFVAATGWWGVALRREPWAAADPGVWRAATSLTYANAAAALLVVAVLLVLAGGLDRACPRLGVDLAGAGLLLGAAATQSRAGLLALVVGLVVLTAARGRGLLLRLVPMGLGAAVAFVGLVPSLPTDAPARPVPAVLALVAGAVVVAGLSGGSRRLAVAAAPALIAAVALAPVVAGAVGGRDGARLQAASSDRAREWSAAWDQWSGSPLVGVGPGRVELRWFDDGLFEARYVHNEYLQTAAELGLVGLVLVVALALVLVGRARTTAARAGALAGVAAFAVHSGLDFLWHVPVVPLFVGAVVAAARPPNEDQHQGDCP